MNHVLYLNKVSLPMHIYFASIYQFVRGKQTAALLAFCLQLEVLMWCEAENASVKQNFYRVLQTTQLYQQFWGIKQHSQKRIAFPLLLSRSQCRNTMVYVHFSEPTWRGGGLQWTVFTVLSDKLLTVQKITEQLFLFCPQKLAAQLFFI